MSTATKDYKAQARKRAAEMNTSIWYKLKEGENCFRILPTPESKKTQGRWLDYGVHRDVGPKKLSVRCGKDPVTDEGSCWLCDVQIPKLRKKGHESRAAALEVRPTTVMQVAKVTTSDDGEKMTFAGPFLFSPSKGVAAQLLSNIIGSKKRDYDDPKKGYNITLSRTGTGKNDTRYGVIEADSDPSKVPSSLIDKLKPFSELKEIPEYNEAKQKATYSGIDDADDEDEDDDDDEPKTKSKKGKKSDDDDDDDDDGDSDDADGDDDDDDDDKADAEDDEDDDEPPVKKKKKGAKEPPKKDKKKSSDDDDDDDTSDSDSDDDDDDDDAADGDDDDDDDDEKPKKKGAPAKKDKKKSSDDDDDEDPDLDDDDDDKDEGDDGDDDDTPPKKKSTPKLPPKKKK